MRRSCRPKASSSEKGFEEASKQVLNSLHGHFRPEFLNRVDDIMIFRPLGKGQLVKIIELRLEDAGVCWPSAKFRSNSPTRRKICCSATATTRTSERVH